MGDPSDALCDLLHFNLNDLVLQVNAFLFDLRVKDLDCLWLSVRNYLFFELVHIEGNLVLGVLINLLQRVQFLVDSCIIVQKLSQALFPMTLNFTSSSIQVGEAKCSGFVCRLWILSHEAKIGA